MQSFLVAALFVCSSLSIDSMVLIKTLCMGSAAPWQAATSFAAVPTNHGTTTPPGGYHSERAETRPPLLLITRRPRVNTENCSVCGMKYAVRGVRASLSRVRPRTDTRDAGRVTCGRWLAWTHPDVSAWTPAPLPRQWRFHGCDFTCCKHTFTDMKGLASRVPRGFNLQHFPWRRVFIGCVVCAHAQSGPRWSPDINCVLVVVVSNKVIMKLENLILNYCFTFSLNVIVSIMVRINQLFIIF